MQRPSPSISEKVNPDYTFFHYLYLSIKAPHFLRIWSVSTPDLPRTNIGFLFPVIVLWEDYKLKQTTVFFGEEVLIYH